LKKNSSFSKRRFQIEGQSIRNCFSNALKTGFKLLFTVTALLIMEVEHISTSDIDAGEVPAAFSTAAKARAAVHAMAEMWAPCASSDTPQKRLAEYFTKSTWAGLKEGQRRKAISVYLSLSVSEKRVVDTATLEVVEPALLGAAPGSTEAPICTDTNVHDKVRLLHLFCDVKYAIVWSNAHRTWK
jgi:hypothetical protein